VKPTSAPQDEEIIKLLQRLGSVKVEYPDELLAARRLAFITKLEQRRMAGADKQEYPSEGQVIDLLEGLKPITADYPPDLLAARRAAFLAQIEEHNRVVALEESPSEEQVIELLGNLKPAVSAYPSELLAARRAAFIAQIRQHNREDLQEEALPLQNGRVFKLLERLKSIEVEYPLKLWSARRSAVVAQIRDGRVSILEALRSTLRNLFSGKSQMQLAPVSGFRRLSVVIATVLVAVFMGSLAYGNRQPIIGIFGPSIFQREVSHPTPMAAVTDTGEVAEVICKPGYLPPLCLAQRFDKSRDLTFPGNGSARPAVAKDTIPGYGRIHKAAYINDGLYGPGASWISNSAYSWIKVDLGEVMTINTITFGRDRLGNFNDGDPGQFVVAVAISDNVYADGDSSEDAMEYTAVYDSQESGFDGIVSGPETIKASFDPVPARFVKITFQNAGTAVDEIEVFMLQPPGFASLSTQRPRDTSVPPTFTAVPTNTLIPSKTPTRIPTRTPFPTNTATLWPTFTPRPTNTNTPIPTDTPLPPPTDTPVPPPTNTSILPSDTPESVMDTPDSQPMVTGTPEAFEP